MIFVEEKMVRDNGRFVDNLVGGFNPFEKY